MFLRELGANQTRFGPVLLERKFFSCGVPVVQLFFSAGSSGVALLASDAFPVVARAEASWLTKRGRTTTLVSNKCCQHEYTFKTFQKHIITNHHQRQHHHNHHHRPETGVDRWLRPLCSGAFAGWWLLHRMAVARLGFC